VEGNLYLPLSFYFMENELPEASWKERVLFFLGRRHGFLVEGNSMLPVLKDGDAVLIKPKAEFAAGDIVLAKHPFKESVKILKRIGEISSTGNFVLTGDNAGESTDSRTLGEIQAKDVLGKVVCRLK
jgi:nickel-type superoxide dismutase maturation protease